MCGALRISRVTKNAAAVPTPTPEAVNFVPCARDHGQRILRECAPRATRIPISLIMLRHTR